MVDHTVRLNRMAARHNSDSPTRRRNDRRSRSPEYRDGNRKINNLRNRNEEPAYNQQTNDSALGGGDYASPSSSDIDNYEHYTYASSIGVSTPRGSSPATSAGPSPEVRARVGRSLTHQRVRSHSISPDPYIKTEEQPESVELPKPVKQRATQQELFADYARARSASPDPEPTIRCANPGCLYDFMTQEDLTQHRADFHTPEGLREKFPRRKHWQCTRYPQCMWEFDKHSDYKKHLGAHHSFDNWRNSNRAHRRPTRDEFKRLGLNPKDYP